MDKHIELCLKVLIENETGKKVKIQLVKYEDQAKKGSLEKENYKTFRFDYREKMQIKREENQRLKEEIAKQLEEEAKLVEVQTYFYFYCYFIIYIIFFTEFSIN